MRYLNRNVERIKFVLKIIVPFLFFGMIANIIFFTMIAPRPLKNAVFNEFQIKKLFYPLVATIEQSFTSANDLNYDRLDLTIPAKDWDEFKSNPPYSGRRWFDAWLTLEGQVYPVEIKQKGFTHFHYAGPKKSVWIRGKGLKTINGWTRVSLNNQKKRHHAIDPFIYRAGEEFGGVLTPFHTYKHMYINRDYLGFYHQIEDFNETFLNKKGLEKDSIYYFDVYKDLVGAFYRPELWRKRVIKEGATKEDRNDIAPLLQCLEGSCQNIEDFIHMDSYLKVIIAFELGGSTHLDSYHNHRLYFDPKINKFRPILWDIGTMDKELELDQSWSPISRAILENPIYRQMKLAIQYEMLTEKVTDKFINDFFDDYWKKTSRDVLFDRYMGSHVSMPFFEFSLGSLETKDVALVRRGRMLERSLNFKNVRLEKVGEGEYNLYYNSPHIARLFKVETSNEVTKQLKFVTSKDEIVVNIGESGELNNPLHIFSPWKGRREIILHQYLQEYAEDTMMEKYSGKVKIKLVGTGEIKAVYLHNIIGDKVTEVLPVSSKSKMKSRDLGILPLSFRFKN